MKSLELLLEKKWIIKSVNKDLYYKIRDDLGEIRKFTTEKLGCQIIENSLLVKLEKIPAKPESFMGIEHFSANMEYVFLCMILMFLEDKEVEEQFILSQLTEYIAANFPDGNVDWTSYTNRRQLIKALRYAVQNNMIRITDGSDDVFMDANSGEVLYENTGTSKYFMRNFTKDIMEYETPKEFEASEWFDVNEDRGIMRRNRVYKKLLFLVAMYKEQEQDEDFKYLKYYGRRLAEDLEQFFDCQLHIHKSSAFLLLGDNCKIGRHFPENNTLSDIILLLNAQIYKKMKSKAWRLSADETIHVTEIEFNRLVRTCKMRFNEGFSKEYREMPTEQFIQTVKAEMIRLTMLKQEEMAVVIMPVIGKIVGEFPEGFRGEKT